MTRARPQLSPRLSTAVDALPLEPGCREIGCGPGAAAREVAYRVAPGGHVLAVDRSARPVRVLEKTGAPLIDQRLLTVVHADAAEIALASGEPLYDFAFAIRAGALDGRHPELRQPILENLRKMTRPGAVLYIDGGAPLTPISLDGHLR